MLNPGEITIIISIVVVAGLVLLYNKFSNKLPSVTGSATVMSSNWKLWSAAVGAILTVGLLWWFWGTLNESLWWRVAPLVLIAFICFRWAKSKDKSLPANIGNAALISLAVVLLVSAPGRSMGNWFDTKAEAVTENGVSALAPGSSGSSGDCSSAQTVEKYGETFMLRKGCEDQLLRVPMSMDEPWYIVKNGRFSGEFTSWGKADWDTSDATLIHVKNLRWPKGVAESEIEVEVVTAAEAARRKRLTESGMEAPSGANKLFDTPVTFNPPVPKK